MCEEPQTERLHVESKKGIPQGEPNGHKRCSLGLSGPNLQNKEQ